MEQTIVVKIVIKNLDTWDNLIEAHDSEEIKAELNSLSKEIKSVLSNSLLDANSIEVSCELSS